MKHLALAGVVLALSSCAAEEPAEQSLSRVEVARVETGSQSHSATVTGEVMALERSDLSFRVAGRIAEVHVEIGQRVEAGELLAELDDSQQRADLEIATAGVSAAGAQLAQARSNADRQRDLFQRGVIARATLDEAEESLQSATGALVAARSERDTAREGLSDTQLHAQEAGLVLGRSAEPGQVTQEAETVLVLAHGRGKEAVFHVPESVLFDGRPTGVAVSLLDASLPALPGRITEISPSVDPQTGTVTMKVALLDSGEAFPLGAPVAGVVSFSARDVIVLPWTALTSSAESPSVWLFDPVSSQVELRGVDLGLYRTGSFQVLGGLEIGDLVVTDGGKLLRVGQVVSPDDREPTS